MYACIVGYHRTKRGGFAYHVTLEQKNTGLTGENVATVFSQVEHELGEEIKICCSKSNGVYTYFEVK